MATVKDMIFYDKVTHSAAGTDQFFTHTRASDGMEVTNMDSANEFKGTQKFILEKLFLLFEEDESTADKQAYLKNSYFKVIVGGDEVLSGPTSVLGYPSGITGFAQLDTSTSTVDASYLGGLGFTLDNPIEIPGDTHFQIEVYSSSSTSTVVRMCMKGKLITQ